MLEAVDPARPGRLLADQAGLPEHSEMPGDCRPADRQIVGHLADGPLSGAEEAEDLPALWVGQRLQSEPRISNHTITVTVRLPIRKGHRSFPSERADTLSGARLAR
jgi:hypothetical protein